MLMVDKNTADNVEASRWVLAATSARGYCAVNFSADACVIVRIIAKTH